MHSFMGNSEDAGAVGATWTIASALTSFFAHGLPTIQFFSGLIAIIVGCLSIVRIIHRWSWDRRKGQ